MIAQRLNVFIPMNVHVLENKEEGFMDENQAYEVVQFSPSQMRSFIKAVKAKKGWKYGNATPYQLAHIPSENRGTDQDPMFDKKHPLPNKPTNGWYYSRMKKRFTGHGGEWYTTREVYFLDKNHRVLYVYYDDAQWS